MWKVKTEIKVIYETLGTKVLRQEKLGIVRGVVLAPRRVRYFRFRELQSLLVPKSTSRAAGELTSHLGISPRVAFQGNASGRPRANQN